MLVRLLAKVPTHEVFKHLRPIALLNASAKIWSRLMFGRLQPLDENNDPGSMGFKKGCNVAKLVLDFHILRDRTLEWGGSFWTSQLDLAAMYDSVGHSCLVESMIQRGLPRAEALWYVPRVLQQMCF